jgi:hypothetical protein
MNEADSQDLLAEVMEIAKNQKLNISTFGNPVI